ncbi:MAG: hypothetical protein ACE37E_19130 [Hyphomicrobiales bacterium]
MDHQILVFDGILDPDAFLVFCAHRAQRLSIDHTVLERSPMRVEVTLRGHAILIDMFEMACSLGPEGSIVIATSRKAA